MNYKYLKYQVKSRKFLLLFLAVVQVLAGFFAFLTDSYSSTSCIQLSAGYTFSFLMISLLVLTPFFFSYVHNKKSVDTYFSLPLSKKELFFNTFFFELLAVFGTWLIPNFFNWFYSWYVYGVGNPLMYLLYILLILLLSVALISFYSTTYLLANNVFDGVVIMLAYIAMPGILLLTINSFMDTFVVGHTPLNFELFGYLSLPLMVCSAFFEMMSTIFGTEMPHIFSLPYMDIIVSLVMGCIFFVTSYSLFIKRPVENAEQNSNHFFAYPFIIHCYTFCLVFIFTSNQLFTSHVLGVNRNLFSGLMIYLIIFVLFMVAHFVYRRKVYIKKSMIIFFVIIIAFSTALSECAFVSRGFGLSYAYPRAEKEIKYSLEIAVEKIEESPTKEALIKECEDILLNNYDANFYTDYAHLSIRFSSPVNGDSKLYQLLEDYRDIAIEEYYEKNDDCYGFRSNMWVINDPNPDMGQTSIFYSFRKVVSEEELKTILADESVSIYYEGYLVKGEETTTF